MSNPAQLIRSWNNIKNYSVGANLSSDNLVPTPWKKLAVLSVKTWREIQLNSTLDWDSKNFSFVLPESLQVVASIFLKIDLPQLTDASYDYKNLPSLYCVDRIRVFSNGSEVSSFYPRWYLREYMSTLSDEEHEVFREAYCGHRYWRRIEIDLCPPAFTEFALSSTQFE